MTKIAKSATPFQNQMEHPQNPSFSDVERPHFNRTIKQKVDPRKFPK